MHRNEVASQPGTIQPHIDAHVSSRTARHWRRVWRLTVALLLLGVVSGCHKKQTEASNENFKRAINAYFYNGRDECLFAVAQKFPSEVKVGD
jgi:hypothetical protein